MKYFKLLLLVLIFTSLFFVPISNVHAQITILPTPTGDCPKFPTPVPWKEDKNSKTKTDKALLTTLEYPKMQCKKGMCWRCSTLSGNFKDTCTNADIPTDIPCNYTLDDIIRTFIRGARLIFAIIGSLALFMFVLGGMFMLTSSGNPEEYKKGMGILRNSIIALIITLGASAIVAATGKWVGANILPTSEVAFTSDCPPRGKQGSTCRNSKESNMVCYYGPDIPLNMPGDDEGTCMSICEYNTLDPDPSLDPAYECVDINTLTDEEKRNGQCQTLMCPGKPSNQCCII